MNPIKYFAITMPSKGHSSIYKIHKYFARRPHNQFRAVIEHYVPIDGIVLDCFAGGGVTLIEGLTANRRVISIDINPVASLVQRGQVLEVSAEKINGITSQLSQLVKEQLGHWYLTKCRHCSERTNYRWIERAYVVNCPHCHEETMLDENSKVINPNGKPKNGYYICNHCQRNFESVSAIRNHSRILSVRYKCNTCTIEETAPPSDFDLGLDIQTKEEEARTIERLGLFIPQDKIPLEWDRQSEDALSRKGFVNFSDLFTIRNRTFIAFMLRNLRIVESELSQNEYLGALTQISALIRYVNSMTFSTSSWMDGRPVAWAKHAYWTPNQFIEVNPFEYLSHRQLATSKWEIDRSSRFANKRGSSLPSDVTNGSADYAIVCHDSRKIDLPNSSIDAVITDPPFGGNVQYGELTHFWQVWLRDANPYEKQLFNLQSEILMHRKKKHNGKTAKDYELGLQDVFKECFRVLKNNGILCFTFNNKRSDAWFAVMKAAFDAGFMLEDSGIHYHEEITAYRDTAHLRYDGELQGDVLYSFVKTETKSVTAFDDEPIIWLDSYVRNANEVLSSKEQAVNLHLAIIRKGANLIGYGKSFEEASKWLDLLSIIGKANKAGESVIDTCRRLILV